MESVMRPMLERILREKYNDAKDCDTEAFLFVARK